MAETPTQTSHEELALEAEAWASGKLTPEGWEDAPEAVVRVGETKSINIRLPVRMLVVLKAFAKLEGVGYQQLMKRWLDERIRAERNRRQRRQAALARLRSKLGEGDFEELEGLIDHLAAEKARALLEDRLSA